MKDEKDVLGRIVRTHVQLAIMDRGIFVYGKMERSSTEDFSELYKDEKGAYDRLKHQTHFFRIKRNRIGSKVKNKLHVGKKEITLASVDQDLISDSPTLSARHTSRGNAIIKLMMIAAIGGAMFLDIAMLSILTNPQISTEQVYNYMFFLLIGFGVGVTLIFTVWYLLGQIDVHIIDCESLDDGSRPGPIPVYLSHPDRGKARDYILRLEGENQEVLDAHAEAARLLNTEKISELSYTIEKLETESDSLKMSLQNLRRRGEDASRYSSRHVQPGRSPLPLIIGILTIGTLIGLFILFG